jgi:chemotaxis protein MotA
MYVLVGAAIVIASILVGYTMHGGKVGALMQYTEFIIIGGSAFGSIVIGYSFAGVKSVVGSCLALLRPSPYNQTSFLDLLRAMYEVFTTARVNGLLSLERHAEHPDESEIFQKYPSFLSNHHAMDLFADTLKIIIMGGVSVYDLSEMMEMDLEVRHEDASQVTNILTTVADSMPGFGIVAAVLGVVITMQAIGGPPELVGEKVGAALVGTFLGVLLAYGVFAPLAKATEKVVTSESQYMACIKNALVAFSRGDAPLVCVEFSRRNIDPELRPSFQAMEDACKQRNKPGESEETAQAA